MAGPLDDKIIVGAINPIEGKVVEVPSHRAIREKKVVPVTTSADATTEKDAAQDSEIQPSLPVYDSHKDHDSDDKDTGDEGVIIVTGADAAAHLLSLRDDGEPALTFRSVVLATVLSGFQAVMYQIYQVRVSVPSILSLANISLNSSNRLSSPSKEHLLLSSPIS